jgi:hypothetical protein
MQQFTRQISAPYAPANDLWLKLQEFQPDAPTTRLTFTQRLARENRWSLPDAQRVFQEYKKFLYLAVTAGHPVTPSDEVDQAWHLHLTYTQSYWNDLCEGILRQPLHHTPTQGGREESQKYNDLYRKTLIAYERTFGHKPPQDIWPAPAKRFSAAQDFARLNTSQYWLIKKPDALSVRAWIFSAAAGAAGLMLAACSAEEMTMTAGLGFVLFIVIVAISQVLQKNRPSHKHRNDSSCSSGCSSCSSDSSNDSGGSDSSSDGGSGCSSGCSSGCGGGCS